MKRGRVVLGLAVIAGSLGWVAANGLADNPGADAQWDAGDTVTYRVQLTVQDDNNAQGKGTGTHRIMWEARNK